MCIYKYIIEYIYKVSADLSHKVHIRNWHSIRERIIYSILTEIGYVFEMQLNISLVRDPLNMKNLKVPIYFSAI